MTLKVIVVYEDFASALRGIEISNAVTAQLNRGFDLNLHVYRFDALNLPEMQRLAVRAAIAAHLIIISVRNQARLPAIVKMWIDGWLPEKRENPGVLVALVHHEVEPREKQRFLRTYLQRKTAHAGVEFVYLCATGSRPPRYARRVTGLEFRHPTNQFPLIGRMGGMISETDGRN